MRFQKCMLSGAAAIAKVVVKAEAREDNWTVQEVGQGPQINQAIGLALVAFPGIGVKVLFCHFCRKLDMQGRPQLLIQRPSLDFVLEKLESCLVS